MIDNETLHKRLAPKLKKLRLTTVEQEQLVRELNYLSDVIIDSYIAKKDLKVLNYGNLKANQSQ